MKPEVDQVLRAAASQLLTAVAPLLDAYARANVEVVATLLVAAAEEYDRAAHIRAEENRAVRKLFADYAPLVSDPPLRGRLTAAAAEQETSLRVSDLNSASDRLRALLIELHAFVEACGEEWAPGANETIWAELTASANRRALEVYPL